MSCLGAGARHSKHVEPVIFAWRDAGPRLPARTSYAKAGDRYTCEGQKPYYEGPCQYHYQEAKGTQRYTQDHYPLDGTSGPLLGRTREWCESHVALAAQGGGQIGAGAFAIFSHSQDTTFYFQLYPFYSDGAATGRPRRAFSWRTFCSAWAAESSSLPERVS